MLACFVSFILFPVTVYSNTYHQFCFRMGNYEKQRSTHQISGFRSYYSAFTGDNLPHLRWFEAQRRIVVVSIAHRMVVQRISLTYVSYLVRQLVRRHHGVSENRQWFCISYFIFCLDVGEKIPWHAICKRLSKTLNFINVSKIHHSKSCKIGQQGMR